MAKNQSPDFALRSIRTVLDPDLADHLLQQGIRAPSRWALSRGRLEFDFASMVFARKFSVPSRSSVVHPSQGGCFAERRQRFFGVGG